jgi:hypothetical protein
VKLSLGLFRSLRSLRSIPTRGRLAGLALVLAFFAACANASEGDAPPADDGGTPEAGLPEASGSDANADAARDGDADAAALRCSGDTCLVDLPSSAIYGLSKWVFAGVFADPQIGVWAIANGVDGTDDSATAQLLHFENDAWKVRLGVTLGADARSVKLASISGDGKGKLLAVGTTKSDSTGVILEGDGTTFTVKSFAQDLRATWVAAPKDAYVVGGDGGVFHSKPDGGWQYEGHTPADFVSVWGSGSGDVYVGGSAPGDFQDTGFLGHRTVLDGGAKKWTYSTFPSPEQDVGTARIIGGIAAVPGKSWWAGAEFFGNTTILARSGTDGGQEVWTRDKFAPHVDLNGFWARAENDLWAVGGLGRLYHYDGATWKDAFLVFNGAPLTKNLRGVTGTSAGELFIVGEDVALRRMPK